jgi:hypothetical protein
MVQQAQHQNLNKKLPVALQPITIKLFYSNNLQIVRKKYSAC